MRLRGPSLQVLRLKVWSFGGPHRHPAQWPEGRISSWQNSDSDALFCGKSNQGGWKPLGAALIFWCTQHDLLMVFQPMPWIQSIRINQDHHPRRHGSQKHLKPSTRHVVKGAVWTSKISRHDGPATAPESLKAHSHSRSFCCNFPSSGMEAGFESWGFL